MEQQLAEISQWLHWIRNGILSIVITQVIWFGAWLYKALGEEGEGK